MTFEPQTASEHLDAAYCPDSPTVSHPASSTASNANPRSTKETTAMTASSPRSTNTPAPAAAASARPQLFDIVGCKVVAILRDKGNKEAIPHALILAFGSTSGMLRGRDVAGDAEAQRKVMKSARRGDDFTVMVTDIKGTVLEPKYDLSEARATQLLAARELIGQTLRGHVSNVQPFGAFINLGDNRSGLLHVSEMGSHNQQTRRAQLASKRGTQVDATVLAVEVDPGNPARLLFELSEVEAELNKTAKLAGQQITAIIVGPSKTGLKLMLKSGVELSLPYENFGSLDLQSLEVGASLRVKILGIIGRALLVTYEK